MLPVVAPGDSITSDFQVEANEFVVGPGTPYRIGSYGALRARKIRSEDLARPGLPGVLPGRDVPDTNTIVLSVNAGDGNNATTADEAMALADDLSSAWLYGETGVLVYQLPGRGKRRRYGRFRNIDPDLDSIAVGYLEALCEFEATDPREYDNDEFTATTGLPSVSGGLTFNATPNFTFGAVGTGGTLLLVNEGDIPAPWIANILGDVVDPYIESVTTGQILRLQGTVELGDVLTLDSDDRSVFLNDASRFEWVQGIPEWPDLLPGTNEWRFNGASGSGSIEVVGASTWA